MIEGLREKLAAGQKEHKDLHVSLVDHQELLKNAKDKWGFNAIFYVFFFFLDLFSWRTK